NDDVMSSQSTGVQGYAVSEDGCIDFPCLGRIEVAGKTREEIAAYVKQRLVDEGLVQDPTVTVEYLNLKVSVLGEVNRPGRVNIDRDEYTILDALSAVGDLTIYGRRENVKVVRAENGVRNTYVVDLCSAQDLFSSPVYYLQQNDMIYVEPNDVRARQSTVNGNNVRSTSFWISLASLLTSVTSTLFLIFR
ncbi:MAG: polysaccharide biosynthesis/export family protein, partial [Candidatus Cryptobacteroides sp.]